MENSETTHKISGFKAEDTTSPEGKDPFQEMVDDIKERISKKMNGSAADDNTVDVSVSVKTIDLPALAESPAPDSNYSSSSECIAEIKARIRKRYCVKCDKRFKRTTLLHEHIKANHMGLPVIKLAKIDGTIRSITIPKSSNGDGLKLTLKCSTGDNFSVVSNSLTDNRHKEEERPLSAIGPASKDTESSVQEEKPRIRVVSDLEIKRSPSEPARVPQLPFGAMVELSQMTFNNEQPAIVSDNMMNDGSESFPETTEQMLQKILENNSIPQDSEWTPPSNEFISIENLGHSCPVCSSTFPSDVLLKDHKRLTGHDPPLLNGAQSSRSPQEPVNNQTDGQFLKFKNFAKPPPYRHPGMPLDQMEHQVRSFQIPPQIPANAQQLRPPYDNSNVIRRSPPPLYRANNPQPHQQPVNMAPFMGMNPDMYNPMSSNGQVNNMQQKIQSSINMAQNMVGNKPPNMLLNNIPHSQAQAMPILNGTHQQMQRNHFNPNQMMNAQQRNMIMQNMGRREPHLHQRHLQSQPSNIQGQAQSNQPQSGQPSNPQLRNVMSQQSFSLLQHQRMNMNSLHQHQSAPTQHSLLQQQLEQLPLGLPSQINRPPLGPPSSRFPINVKRPAISNHLGPTKPSNSTVQTTAMINGFSNGRPMQQHPAHGPPAKRARSNTLVTLPSRSNGLPIIQSVQSGVGLMSNDKSMKDTTLPQISDQVTLSVKNKDAARPSSQSPGKNNPKEVANILAHRGIIVTPTAKPNDQKKSDDTANNNVKDAIHKRLNNAVSITSVKKPTLTETTIDLSHDDGQDATTTTLSNSSGPKVRTFIKCPYKSCSQRFVTAELVRKHTIQVHRQKPDQRTLLKCKQCLVRFTTPAALALHIRKTHKSLDIPKLMPIDQTTMGIPIVNLADETTRNKLEQLGITNYIPMHNFQQEGGLLGLPIMSIKDITNNKNLTASKLGVDQVLPLGAIKSILKEQPSHN